MKTGTLALREGVFLCSQTHITNKLATYIGLILLLVFLNLQEMNVIKIFVEMIQLERQKV